MSEWTQKKNVRPSYLVISSVQIVTCCCWSIFRCCPALLNMWQPYRQQQLYRQPSPTRELYNHLPPPRWSDWSLYYWRETREMCNNQKVRCQWLVFRFGSRCLLQVAEKATVLSAIFTAIDIPCRIATHETSLATDETSIATHAPTSSVLQGAANIWLNLTEILDGTILESRITGREYRRE
jgi:hypothetical protein